MDFSGDQCGVLALVFKQVHGGGSGGGLIKLVFECPCHLQHCHLDEKHSRRRAT